MENRVSMPSLQGWPRRLLASWKPTDGDGLQRGTYVRRMLHLTGLGIGNIEAVPREDVPDSLSRAKPRGLSLETLRKNLSAGKQGTDSMGACSTLPSMSFRHDDVKQRRAEIVCNGVPGGIGRQDFHRSAWLQDMDPIS